MLSALYSTRRGEAIASCVAYSFCSISMVLANKALVSTMQFRSPLLLTFLQNGVAVLLVVGCGQLGLLEYDKLQAETARKWLPVNVLFTLMLLTSFLRCVPEQCAGMGAPCSRSPCRAARSLGLLSVPMVTIFKNLTNVLIVAGDWYYFGQPVSAGVVGSLAIMMLGALLAGYYDLAFSATGYAWMLLNCAATAGYVLYTRKAMDSTKLSKFGMVYYNNVMSLPFLLTLSLAAGEAGPADRALLALPSFWTLLVFSGSVGFFLSFASMWCMRSTSPTTYSIVGSLNKVPLTVFGILLFSVPVDTRSVVFISLSLLAGMLYTHVKQQEAAAAKTMSRAAAIQPVGGSPKHPASSPPDAAKRSAV